MGDSYYNYINEELKNNLKDINEKIKEEKDGYTKLKLYEQRNMFGLFDGIETNNDNGRFRNPW